MVFTRVSVGVYMRKIFTYLSSMLKSKHGISEVKLSVEFM